MQQYLFVGISLLSHNGSTNLAQSYPMPPSFTMQPETGSSLLHIEGRTIEMRLAEDAAYLKFLADSK